MLWKWREKRLQHAWLVHYVTICSNNLQLYLNVFTRVSSSIYNLISLIFHLFFHFALPIFLFFMWVMFLSLFIQIHMVGYFVIFMIVKKYYFYLFFSLLILFMMLFQNSETLVFRIGQVFSSFCCVCFAFVLAVTLIS